MAEENPVDEVGEGRDNHQWDDERIAIGNFGDQEDACQRGVEHACDKTAHAHQGELGRIKLPQTDILHGEGKKQSGESAKEQGGSEGASHAAGAKGQGGGKGL